MLLYKKFKKKNIYIYYLETMEDVINNPENQQKKTPLENTTNSNNTSDKSGSEVTFNSIITNYLDKILQLLGSNDNNKEKATIKN